MPGLKISKRRESIVPPPPPPSFKTAAHFFLELCHAQGLIELINPINFHQQLNLYMKLGKLKATALKL